MLIGKWRKINRSHLPFLSIFVYLLQFSVLLFYLPVQQSLLQHANAAVQSPESSCNRNEGTSHSGCANTLEPGDIERTLNKRWIRRNVFTSRRHRTSSDNTGTLIPESSASCPLTSSWMSGATTTKTPTDTSRAPSWTDSCGSLSPAPTPQTLVQR